MCPIQPCHRLDTRWYHGNPSRGGSHGHPSSENALLGKQLPEVVCVEVGLIGDHLEDARHVGKEIALVPVGEDGRDAGVVELDVLEVYLDEVDGWVGADERDEGGLDGG